MPRGTWNAGYRPPGHILEWLIFSLPEKDLTDPRLVKVGQLPGLAAAQQSQRRVGDRAAWPRPAGPGSLQRAGLWGQAGRTSRFAGPAAREVIALSAETI